jgi:hypothetical protein
VEGILHAGLAHLKFIDIGEGIRDQLEGDPVEGPVGELDGKGFFVIGGAVGLFDVVEDYFMTVIVVGDVEGSAGGGQDY